MLILTGIFYIYTGHSFQFWAFFLFSYGFFIFIILLPLLKIIAYRCRDKSGIKKTKKENLKDKFKKSGGIVGYETIVKRHIALIFVSNSRDNYADVSFEDIKPIIDDCNKKNEDYELYFCYLADDFIKIVRSKYVYKIHIFGHGRMDSLGFEDGILQYRELKDSEPKEFVAQWHCNHGNKIEYSLGHYIGKEYHVPYGYVFFPDIKKNVEKLINGKIKPTKNPNL